jgi:hypothetical protein
LQSFMASTGLRWPALNFLILFNIKTMYKFQLITKILETRRSMNQEQNRKSYSPGVLTGSCFGIRQPIAGKGFFSKSVRKCIIEIKMN